MNAIRHVLEERERQAAKKRKARAGQPRGGKFPQQAEKGKSRDKIGTIAGTSAGQPRGGKFPQQAEKGKSRDKVAKAAGTSARTMTKIREVCEAAEAEPEKYQPLVEEMDRTGRVAGVHKKLKVAKQVQQIKTEPANTPSGRYRVLVVDPPWSYGRAGDTTHRSANPYAQMALEDIYKLPIADWCHEDSILWLWTTNAFMRESYDCLDAWGFEQKTILTWVKNRMGTGGWLRGKTEHCLMAVRGKPTVSLTNQTTALLADTGEHSAKPAEFYVMVEGLCPGSKLDVFARARRDGWEVYGLEAV